MVAQGMEPKKRVIVIQIGHRTHRLIFLKRPLQCRYADRNPPLLQ